MFQRIKLWLLSWIIRTEEERYDVYRPSERVIYSYWGGELENGKKKMIHGDPLILYKRMMAKGPELSIDMKVALSISKDAPAAHDKYIAKIKEIFQIKELSEGGLSQPEIAELLDHFLVYCTMVKKNSSPLPTLSTNMADSKHSSENGQNTSNSLDSGSIADVPSIVNPGPSPSV